MHTTYLFFDFSAKYERRDCKRCGGVAFESLFNCIRRKARHKKNRSAMGPASLSKQWDSYL
jgi:hypothetical protein